MPDTDDLAHLDLTDVAELLRSGRITSTAVTEALLARIDALDPALHSYAHVGREAALEAAARADAELARGRWRGPLHGVPVAVKDLLYTTDAPTASGSTVHAGHRSDHDATVVARLRAAGAVILGKLTMTEGAYTSHHPDLPTPVNPWDADTWSGASSSGSGVAPVAGLCFGALGTDTGGSIRLPSSANGTTGLKPTWGRVSRYGSTALAASMDHVGPMARSARDCAAILGVIAGQDVNDPTASLLPVPDYLRDITLRRAPRFGVDPRLNETFDAPTRAMLEGVVETVRDLGFLVVEVETPDFPAAAQHWAPLCAVETAYEHRATFPGRESDYGPDLRDLITLGQGIGGVEYQGMLEWRRDFIGRCRRLFATVDLLLLPGTGIASPTLAQMANLGSGEDLLAGLLVPTAPLDIAGLPSLTLPGGFTDRGTPLGFQFVGGEFAEQLVLQAGHAYQGVTDFHRRRPSLTASGPVQE